MGLSVRVGVLSDVAEHDPEFLPEVAGEFLAINDGLATKGLPAHDEPADCAVWSAHFLGYSGLHALREAAGFVYAGLEIPRNILLDGKDTTLSDDLVKTFLEHVSGKGDFTLVGRALRSIFKTKEKPKLPPFIHLIVHSDCDGYYVPVAFETPLVPKKTTDETAHLWPLGSVMRLETEMNALADHLQIPADLAPDDPLLMERVESPDRNPSAPLWHAQPIAAHSCVVLRAACAHSLATGAAIQFC